MNHFDGAGLFGHGFDPIDQALLVGVGGVTGKDVNLGFDGFALAVEIDISAGPLAIFLDCPTRRACSLVADEKDVVPGIVDAFLQMIDDPAAGAHAAAGQDDGRTIHIANLKVLLVVLHCNQAFKVNGVVAPFLQIPGLLVPVAGQVGIDFGDFQA